MAIKAHEESNIFEPSEAPLPPPPPPPSPPQDDINTKKPRTSHVDLTMHKNKKQDFRDILALFYDVQMNAAESKRQWNELWQTVLMDSQEEHRRRRQKERHGLKRKTSGEHDQGPVSVGTGSGPLSRHSTNMHDNFKKARQGSTASTDSSESGKGIRLGGRFLKNVAKGSKLMQKFGARP